MLRPTDVRTDYQTPEITDGIPILSTLMPPISWRLEPTQENGADVPSVHRSDESAVDAHLQSAYRIQVATDERFSRLVRDTQWVSSSQSQFVPWDGPPLQALERYLVRVAVRDGAGGESSWSEPMFCETAVVGVSWGTPFISPPVSLMPPDESRPAYLRREFELESVPARARLLATALGVYEVWINGSRIGQDLLTPGWTAYDHRITYQTYDVTPFLRPGHNAIGVVLGYGWYAGDLTWLDTRNLYGDRPAISLAILDAAIDASCVSDTASINTIVDTSHAGNWSATHGPIIYSELYHGEHYDARLELSGWSEPGWSVESLSEPAQSAFGTVPPLQCELLPDSTTYTARAEPQDGPPVRRQEEVTPVAAFITPNGETVIDFGQNLTGWVRMSPVGEAGERIVLSHAEVLDKDGNFYTANMRTARNLITYVLGENARAGAAAWEPHFTFQGFRYIRVDETPVTMRNAMLTTPEKYFTAVVVHSEMDSTLQFSCSDERINQLHHNILWGWKGNALDIPTDCPQRDERLGWTGDAQVFVGTAAYLMNVGSFFRRWLRDLALEQREDGGVPFVIPDVLSAVMHRDPNINDTHSSTGWGDAAVICPVTIARRYNDRGLLSRHYPSMRRWIDFIRGRAENEVLWNTGFHFGDWVALDAKEGSFFGATPNDLTATAYYAYSTALTADTAERLGNTEDAAELWALHERIVTAFRREYYTPSGRLAAQTQTAHLLALAFDLVPPEHRERTVADLIQLIRNNDDHLVTGFLGTPLLLPVFADNGNLDEAYRLLLREEYPSWLFQVKQGATTIWEHWDGMKPDGTMWSPQMNSFNHYAYGAVGEWMYSAVGGIDLNRSDIPGRRFVIAPRPGGGITSAEMSYRSGYGDVSVSWKLVKNDLTVDVELPPNVTAELYWPESSGADAAPGAPQMLGPGQSSITAELG